MTSINDHQMLSESNFDIETLSESAEDEQSKNWYIKGVFLQADVVNRNRRFYPKKIMESAVDKFDRIVENRQAVGELGHPDTLEINMDRIAHKIVEVTREGKNYVGKSLVLNTEPGRVLQGLLEADVRVGVSSRGSGRTEKNGKGISIVGENYKIVAVDSVFNPSAPDAFVEGILENDQSFLGTVQADEEIMEHIRNEIRATRSTDLEARKGEVFMNYIWGMNRHYTK